MLRVVFALILNCNLLRFNVILEKVSTYPKSESRTSARTNAAKMAKMADVIPKTPLQE